MMRIDYPGCERLAWDVDVLYAASDRGWCSRLVPQRVDLFGGKQIATFHNWLLEADGVSVLVGRRMLLEAESRQAYAYGFGTYPNRFAVRQVDEQDVRTAGSRAYGRA